MKDYYMRQCQLQRNNVYLVSWIPDKYAIKGNVIGLKKLEETYEVIQVGQHKMLASVVGERSQDYKNTRKKSDIIFDKDIKVKKIVK